MHKPTLRHIKSLDLNAQFCFHGNAILMYLIFLILASFAARQRMQSMLTETMMNQV